LISKETKLAEDADIISVSLTLPHQTSALYRLLTKFSVSGLNLTMIESRPIANTDFDVLFYLDFEGSVKSPDVVKLIRELETELTYFKFLGNYKEI
jgi:chorismate mutase/prephenate dehydratase